MGTHPIFESDFDCLTELLFIQNVCQNSRIERNYLQIWCRLPKNNSDEIEIDRRISRILLLHWRHSVRVLLFGRNIPVQRVPGRIHFVRHLVCVGREPAAPSQPTEQGAVCLGRGARFRRLSLCAFCPPSRRDELYWLNVFHSCNKHLDKFVVLYHIFSKKYDFKVLS